METQTLNQYELVFIMTPVLSEEQLKEAVAKYRDLLKGDKSEIVHEENWGLKKLAYPIQKKSTGFYHLIEFKAPGETIAKLELALKRDERVMRFLTVKLDKYAIEWSEKRRKKGKEKKEAKNQESKGEKKVATAEE